MTTRIRLVVAAPARAPHDDGLSAWERYELAKQHVANTARSAEEYETRIQKLTEELGL